MLKGAIRRVFSRSDLRKKILHTSTVDHFDVNRPRVKKWSECSKCIALVPTYLIEIDHINPLVPLNKSLEEMSWDELINNTWCPDNNLQPLCESCHKLKTREEMKKRKEFKTIKKILYPRVIRGGSWNYIPQFLRSAYRNSNSPSNRISGVGLRLARTLNYNKKKERKSNESNQTTKRSVKAVSKRITTRNTK